MSTWDFPPWLSILVSHSQDEKEVARSSGFNLLVCHVSGFSEAELEDTEHVFYLPFENIQKACYFSTQIHKLHVRYSQAQIHYFFIIIIIIIRAQVILHIIKRRTFLGRKDYESYPKDTGWYELTRREFYSRDLHHHRSRGLRKTFSGH